MSWRWKKQISILQCWHCFNVEEMLKLGWNPDSTTLKRLDYNVEIWLQTWHWNNVETLGLQRRNLVAILMMKQHWNNFRMPMLKFGSKPDVETTLKQLYQRHSQNTSKYHPDSSQLCQLGSYQSSVENSLPSVPRLKQLYCIVYFRHPIPIWAGYLTITIVSLDTIGTHSDLLL